MHACVSAFGLLHMDQYDWVRWQPEAVSLLRCCSLVQCQAAVESRGVEFVKTCKRKIY